MTCQTCQDRLIDQLSGEQASDDPDQAAHLRECQDCRGLYAELTEAYHAMAFSVPAAVVGFELKHKFMRRLDMATAAPGASSAKMAADITTTKPSMRVERSDEPSQLQDTWVARTFRLFVASAVAAGIAVIVTHAVMMSRYRGLQRQYQQMNLALDFSQRQNVALLQQADQHRAELNVLQAADLRYVNLLPPAKPGEASGRLFLDSNSHKGYLMIRGAPPTPPGRTCELWLINGKKDKMPAGMFKVGAGGTAHMPLKFNPSDMSTAIMAAITDEPAGGTAQPTGPVQMLGKIPS